MTIDDLYRETGIKPRKIRWYISEGVLQPPLRHGRGAPYGSEHIERINLIKRYKDEGLTLAQIRDAVHGRISSDAISVESWNHIVIDQDLVMMARGPAALSRAKEILKGMANE